MIFAALLVGLSLQATQAPPAPSLDYDRSIALDVQPTAARAVRVSDITYRQLDGSRNTATLVLPAPADQARGTRAGILFLHWYEPPKPSSNRTEFLPDAIELAGQGVVSLLVDTPWHTESWFQRRDATKDYDFTLQQSKEVRRALDVLLAQPDIDPRRVVVVGHDFGAMFGAMAAAADPRVTHLVYMAGAPTFSEWWLFAPKREGAERDAFIARLAALRPIDALARMGSRPVLLQFGTKDRFVPNDAATAQANAVKGPKTVKLYDGAEHELTFAARQDRIAWLEDQLGLGK